LLPSSPGSTLARRFHSENAMSDVPLREGRRVFGADAANYDRARPEYPREIYAMLRARCGLKPGTRAFEIGPGTGLATRRLIEAGAAVTAIEPDARLAQILKARSPTVEVVNAVFEDAVLPDAAFDLGASATAFHWIEQRPALIKLAQWLRPGGWWAMWWNSFGDPEREDAFHDATRALFTTPDNHPAPFSLDRAERLGDLDAVGLFEDIGAEFFRWTLVLNPAEVRALYASFSNVMVLDESERRRVLDGLVEIATREFGGRVERNMVSAIYTAQRR
jgi:SAM-dependent methyltransferase